MKATEFKMRSPINLEGSWGQRGLADSVESEITVYPYDDGAYLEWVIEELDMVEGIGLDIQGWGKPRLVGYDGVMSCPAFALRWCQANGINIDEIADNEPPEDEHILYDYQLISQMPVDMVADGTSEWWRYNAASGKFEPAEVSA